MKSITNFIKTIILILALSFCLDGIQAQVDQYGSQQQNNQGGQGQGNQGQVGLGQVGQVSQTQIVQATGSQNDQMLPLASGTQNTLNSIYAIDSATAFVVGNGGKIIKTSDEGKSWRYVPSGVEKNLRSVVFTDANTGYVAGSNGTLLKTTDGGLSWKRLISGTEADLICIYFINAYTGFAGGANGVLLTTSNGGTTWTKVIIDTDKWLKNICFTSPTTGYIAGWNGLMMKTTNGGISWAKIETGVENILESIYFTNATTGFVVGWGGTLITTTDGGTSWQKIDLTNESDLTDINFVDGDNGYIVGMQGIVFKTTDAGKDWDEQYVNEPNDFFSVRKFGSTSVLIAGGRGQLFKCVNAEKLRTVELKTYWDDNEDAYNMYNSALEKYHARDYKNCIMELDSVRKMMGSNNSFTEELLMKCYLDDGEFANVKKELPAYDSLRPDKKSDFYKRIDEFNNNIERYLADEIAWKKAAADTSGAGYDKYVKDHPKGWYRDVAMDEKLWLVAGKSNDPMVFEDYLQKRPNGKYADMARQLSLYYKAKNTGMTQAYEEYFRNFPKGLYHKEVSDSLSSMYIKEGDNAVINKNPEEAERWYRLYEQNFGTGDTANIIKQKLDAIPALRRQIADDQVRMQKEQQKNQMKEDLRRERGDRNRKLVKTIVWGAIAAGGGIGSYYLISSGHSKDTWPGIACGAIAGGALIGFVEGWSNIHFYQRHVREIRGELKNLSLLPVVYPLNNTFGMVLQFRF